MVVSFRVVNLIVKFIILCCFPFSNVEIKTKLTFFRNGVTTSEYAVPNTDHSAVGSYTCQVTIFRFNLTSVDSIGYTLTATGWLEEPVYIK